jgi:hypothetical protein
VRTLAELEERFPGTIRIVSTWFSGYKLDPGRVEVTRSWGLDVALERIDRCHADYRAGRNQRRVRPPG